MTKQVKTMPHSLEAERAVFGGIFNRPLCLDSIVSLLTAEDFYTPSHAVLWEEIKAMYQAGESVTITAVSIRLRGMGKFEAVGGAEALASLAQEFVTGARAEWYAQVVHDYAVKRKIITECADISAECQLGFNHADDLLSRLRSLGQNLRGASGGERHVGDVCLDLMETLKAGETAKPIPTPWNTLNRILRGGIVPGELVVLAARPGVGKTAFAGCLAIEVSRSGLPVLFVSREVKDTTLVGRMLAREAAVDVSIFRKGTSDAAKLADVRQAMNRLMTLPLHILEKSVAPMTPSEIRRVSRTLKKKPGLVVIDYLQLLNPDMRSASREREVAEMSRALKQMALDLECPVLLLSQLNRRAEEGDREPRLSDLRESGAIEQDADIVLLLHSRQKDREQIAMPIKCSVAKSRSSGTGFVAMRFDKPHQNFFEDDPQTWAKQAVGEDNGL